MHDLQHPSSRSGGAQRRLRVAVAVAGAAAAVVAVGAVVPAAAVPTTNITVDAGSVVRPVTHVGSGGLYALASATTPDPSTLAPLHLNQLTQPAPGTTQLGNGATEPSGDALKVASSAISAGAQETVRMADIYPDFPYKWVSWSDYLGKVDKMVQQRLSADSTTNINGWELWNEPDGTWDTKDAGSFDDGWTRIYNEVKKYDTVTPIVGPSISSYNHDFMESFLTNAKATNTLPDVISWHLWSADALPGALSDLRSIESSLGISPRPVSINEYSWMNQVDVPAQALRYLATFERSTDVRDAERAYWYESGTVDGLFYNGQPTGTYWLYKWYGEMTGNIVSTTQNGAQDGVASLDTTQKKLTAVVGGGTGDNALIVDNLSGFGDDVAVTIQSTPDSGRLHNVGAPTLVWSGTARVVNGTVTVSIPQQDPGAAYQIVVTPSTGPTTSYQQTYEAENASVVNGIRYTSANASNGGYVGGLDNSGDVRNDSFVDFLVDAPVAGAYDLSIRYANGTGADATQGIAYDGGAWSTVTYPATAGWGQFASVNGPTLQLKAGYNVVRLAKGSPGFSGGVGYAELDSITVTSRSSVPAWSAPANPSQASFVSRVEAESSAVTDGNVLRSDNASNGGYVAGLNNSDSAVTFTVDVPAAGTYRLQLGYANGGDATQNGTTQAVVAMSVNGGSASNLTLPTTGQWGGNGGSFAVFTTTVDLNQGDNTISITHLDNQNYAELDYAQVSSPATAVVR